MSDGLLSEEQLAALERGDATPEVIDPRTLVGTSSPAPPSIVPGFRPVWTPSDEPATPPSGPLPKLAELDLTRNTRGNLPRAPRSSDAAAPPPDLAPFLSDLREQVEVFVEDPASQRRVLRLLTITARRYGLLE